MGRMVEFPINGVASRGYLAVPESGEGPGVIVLQEWWGLVDHIKDIADRFAAAGFVALAPDMYHGQTATEPDGAGKLFMALNIGRAEKDLRGAALYLRGHSSTAKIGAVGFCMGGQLALFAATLNPAVGACVNFYGIHPNVKPDFSKLSCPVLGLFGKDDGSVSPAAVQKLADDIRAAGASGSFESRIYENAGHAFFNDSRPDAYVPEAAADAWKRTLNFFAQKL